MKLVLTQVADDDIAAILQDTYRLFGPSQLEVYAGLIQRTLDLVAAEPRRPSSVDRSDLHSGLRSLRVSVAAGRVKGASHVAFYVMLDNPNCSDEVYVIRVLHQSMDPAAHIEAGLRGLPSD